MDKLEELKRSNSNCEEIANETVGIPYVEQYALKLFDAAYQRDINSDFGPYIEKTRKYAKWKAVYISKCLKSGEVPVGGPIANTEAAYTPNISGLTNTNNLCNNETNQQPHEVPTTCIPKQPPSPDPSASDNNITTRNWLNVEKDIKCALSASNYQDRETTVKYLKQALKSLGVDI
uniref:Vacuolar protein sorting-associated protein VTA1-like protein n=1 Tax=Schistosoma haematobium TaxID=6185 RepID=A0A095A1X4_SCHHA